jgi:Rps23 Pro-64 3,4-dihydroxylase Tpa1-like proline 4-hydroxylase
VDINIIRDPVNIIKINDVFTKVENNAILEEMIYNEKTFQDSVTCGKPTDMRNNTVSYYDNVYQDNRQNSALLTVVDSLFKSDEFQALMRSSPIPFRLFKDTNTHETQVSRYGDSGQKYDWHLDTINNHNRLITMVYYVNKEPKNYIGGEILFSNSPTYKGNLMEREPNKISFTPENNTAYIFDSATAHCVLPTKSPKKFDDGRFSVNIWIGTK